MSEQAIVGQLGLIRDTLKEILESLNRISEQLAKPKVGSGSPI